MTPPIIFPTGTNDLAYALMWPRVQSLARRPIATRWFPVLTQAEYNTIIGDPALEDPRLWALLKNGWTNPLPPKGKMSWRVFRDGSIEFKGHLVPGTSGLPAFTLPGLLSGPEEDWEEPDHRPAHDVSFLADVETSPNTFSIARVFIDNDTGDVTITFPAA